MFTSFSLLTLAAITLPSCHGGLPAQKPNKIPEARLRGTLPAILRSAEIQFSKDGNTVFVLRHFSNKPEPVLCVFETYYKGKALASRELGHSLVGSDLFGKAELDSDRLGIGSALFRKQGVRMAVGRDGNIFLTSSHKTVRVWQISKRPAGRLRSIRPLGGPLQHAGSVRAAFSSDGKQLLTANLSGGHRLRDKVYFHLQRREAHTGKPLSEPAKGMVSGMRGPFATMKSLVWAPDDATFLIAYRQRRREAQFLQLWDAKTLKPLGEPVPAAGDRHQFSGDSKKLLVISKKERISVWDVAERKPVRKLSDLMPGGRAGQQPLFVTHADGFSVLGRRTNEQVELWDLRPDPPVKKQVFKHSSFVNRLALAADGKFAATETADEVRIWSLENGRALARIPSTKLSGRLRAMEFSPNGRLLATVTDADVQLWVVEKE